MVSKLLVVDAGPLLGQTREQLLSRADKLVTTPAVYAEIRDDRAREKLKALVDSENIMVQQPSQQAVAAVTEAARRTGDLTVLSGPDIGIIALAYDLSDNSTLQPVKSISANGLPVIEHQAEPAPSRRQERKPKETITDDGWAVVPKKGKKSLVEPEPEVKEEESDSESDEDNEDDDNEDDWITPDNLASQLSANMSVSGTTKPAESPVALASHDFAVQNVALQIGIAIVNDQNMRVSQLRTTMQRCHACFKLVHIPQDGTPARFCPQCGGHTLTRVTVNVRDGALHIFLKANMQWRTRGDRYSVQNPQSRRARRADRDAKVELYAEDQPEYLKAMKHHQRQQLQNEKLVNNWIGPSIGDSAAVPFVTKKFGHEAVRIGRGRNANMKNVGAPK